jgi:ribosomal protein S18 acetylase RimI-like enzyme
MECEIDNIVYDDWLSSKVGRDVYKFVLDDDFIKSVNQMSGDGYKKILIFKKQSVFLYSKVSTTYVMGIYFLEKLRFNLVDTNITFVKPVVSNNSVVGNCHIRFAVPEDQKSIVDLARKSFVCTRFHLDPEFPNNTADTIKGEWVRNYFEGNRGDRMVVALIDNNIVGIVQLLYGNDKTLIIDQIAVDEKFRRMGIAKDMISFAETQCHGFIKICVGTQLANMPSVNLYENIGFRFSGAHYVFHYHNK